MCNSSGFNYYNNFYSLAIDKHIKPGAVVTTVVVGFVVGVVVTTVVVSVGVDVGVDGGSGRQATLISRLR